MNSYVRGYSPTAQPPTSTNRGRTAVPGSGPSQARSRVETSQERKDRRERERSRRYFEAAQNVRNMR